MDIFTVGGTNNQSELYVIFPHSFIAASMKNSDRNTNLVTNVDEIIVQLRNNNV